MSGGIRRGLLRLFESPPPLAVPSTSRRTQQRFGRALATVNVCNAAISAVNRLSSPTPFGSFNNSVSSLFSSLPQRTVSRIEDDVLEASRVYTSRTASAFADAVSGDVDSDVPYLSHGMYFAPSAAAIQIKADLVDLPDLLKFPPVPLLDFLPSDLRARYSAPSPAILAEVPPLRSNFAGPTPRVFGARREYVALLARMHDIRMLDWRRQVRAVAGVFSVPKPEGRQRPIINCEQANGVWRDPDKVILAGPDAIGELEVPEGKTLFVAQSDISNFFHRILLPEWMVPYFALPRVRVSELPFPLPGFGPDEFVYPCCRTLPMGWTHSPLLAQHVHQTVVSRCPSFHASAQLLPAGFRDLASPRHLIYLDDFNIFGVGCPDRLNEMLDEYLSVLRACGFPPKVSKVKRASVRCVSLGLEVDGGRRRVALAADKQLRLIRDTRAVLARGACTGHDLQVLVGRWTWCMLVRRESLSAFSSVYRFGAIVTESAALWPSVRAELEVAVGLMPLLFADLSLGWFKHAVASDASLWAQGVVYAPVDPEVASTLAHDGAAAAPKDPTPRQLLPRRQSPASVTEFVKRAGWKTCVSDFWRFSEPIAYLECRAVHTAFRWVLSHADSRRTKALLLIDSGTVEGALRKGRSSSWALLHRQRHISALSLASGLRLRPVWVPSSLNPADKPSRPPR